MDRRVLIVGWDVGGWRGKKQGLAAAWWTADAPALTWIGQPRTHRVPESLWTLDQFIDAATGGEPIDSAESEVVVAIDAPLGFPRPFVEFLSRPDAAAPSDPYANLGFRGTEAHIRETFCHRDPKGKPLKPRKIAFSAPFDKIGANATVAMAHMRLWKNDVRWHPQQEKARRVSIIEVYPALVKQGSGGATQVAHRFKKLLGGKRAPALPANSDRQDAAICVALGACFASHGRFGFELEEPAHPLPEGEGWIYYVEPGLLWKDR